MKGQTVYQSASVAVCSWICVFLLRISFIHPLDSLSSSFEGGDYFCWEIDLIGCPQKKFIFLFFLCVN